MATVSEQFRARTGLSKNKAGEPTLPTVKMAPPAQIATERSPALERQEAEEKAEAKSEAGKKAAKTRAKSDKPAKKAAKKAPAKKK